MDAKQMHLNAKLSGTPSFMSQKSLLGPLIEVKANRTHVSRHLVPGFFEVDIEAALPSATGSINEGSGESGFTAAGSPCDKHAGTAEIALPFQHFIQIGHT